MAYSTAEEIQRFTDMLAKDATSSRSPLFVLDMDGNILIGYNAQPGYSLPPVETPERRSIPADADMDALLRQGVVKAKIFADKPLDVRLPKTLVTHMNLLQQAGKPFVIAILTSRSEADALTILRDSGVEDPQWHTLITDSGAILRLHGKRHPVQELSRNEQVFLGGLTSLTSALEEITDKTLKAQGFANADRPFLHLEAKGIASNIHFREILRHYGQADDSKLAHMLIQALEAIIRQYIAIKNPLDAQGKPVFTLLHGPATLEVKLARIHKGHGLQALVTAALEDGVRPSAVIFAGDDVCNRNMEGLPSPGTDYYAFRAIPDLARCTGIPMHTIHTLHPADGQPEPDTAKVPMPELAKPDLTVPTPVALVEVVDGILECCNFGAGEAR